MDTILKFKIKPKNLAIPLVVFVFSLLLTGFVWKETRDLIIEERDGYFQEVISDQYVRIKEGIDKAINVSYSLRGFLAGSDFVRRDEWSSFLDSVHPPGESLFGIQAIEYITYVTRDEKSSFIEGVKSDDSLDRGGYPGFTIFPEGDRDEYYVVTYIEPFKGNETAFGFDLLSEPERREALEVSRDRNILTATAPINLIQYPDRQAGFLVFLPIYESGAVTNTVKERRDSLKGFVVSVFRVDDLLRSILSISMLDINNAHLRIKDTTGGVVPDNFIFDQFPVHVMHQNLLDQKDILVGERTWTLYFYEHSGLNVLSGIEAYAASIAAGIGLLFSILLFLIILSFASTREKAVLLAEEMTKENEEVRKELEKRAFELESANKVMMGREARIVDLKEKNKKLETLEGDKPSRANKGFYDSNI